MDDEKISKILREIANNLENQRVNFYQNCDADSYYNEEKQKFDDKIFSLQSQIREIANLLDIE